MWWNHENTIFSLKQFIIAGRKVQDNYTYIVIQDESVLKPCDWPYFKNLCFQKE
jgi:hypothetical protein